jgi:hypothetical protein
MLKDEDEQWLGQAYPGLVRDAKGVAGSIKFKATYNSQSGIFLILGDDVMDTVGGMALAGEFRIRVEEPSDKSIPALPAVYVEEVEMIADRHFNRIDKSACLCSPLEENEFLEPEFQFRFFLERLVVPFLYGQVFYSRNRCWPWSEYAHGSAGILESYFNIAEPARAEDCLRRLAQEGGVWPRLKAALQQEPYIKGHTPCFCPKKDQIRRCHPLALRGALRLQQDLRTLAIPIP